MDMFGSGRKLGIRMSDPEKETLTLESLISVARDTRDCENSSSERRKAQSHYLR